LIDQHFNFMSEAFEKVSSIKQLAVFPLPLVLLPHESLPLHIFEPRYRQMLLDIEDEQNLFGITLYEPKDDFSEAPEIGSTGCVAEVRESQMLEDGRSKIETSGLIRYRLLEYVDIGKPYLTAEVEFFEDIEEDETALLGAADEVFTLFERIAKAAFDLSGNRGKFPEIQRSDPERLSFIVTAAFNLENKLKYDMLEMDSTLERLKRLNVILKSAVGSMEESAGIIKASQTNGHSKKKLDI
jgi:Lon protease-like protein